MQSLEDLLIDFRRENGFIREGQLSVALHVTRVASQRGLPLSPDDLVTKGTGQVAGLSGAAVQAILSDYGITRILAIEGGRTSRGSLGKMRCYVPFLNSLHQSGLADIKFIEKWWIERVREFFNKRPFVLRYDSGKSLRSMVSDILSQAMKRQKECPGATFAGTVLQHLIGAKLDLILPEGKRVTHFGASVADAASSRPGDFLIDDTAIHVTTAPTENLLRKCKINIEQGLSPIIVTISESRPGVESLAKSVELDARIDIIEAEQFIATNLHEWTLFDARRRREEIKKFFSRYNEIIAAVETDPSLRVELP